jgi:regulator of protease activity HflC (stomatin/prohibitin superfamily)
VLALTQLTACGFVESGNVGVRTAFGETSTTEEGVGFYTSIIGSVDEFSVKEIPIALQNMTPKAKDNLSLKDLDVTVYYQVQSDKIADLQIKYAGASVEGSDGKMLPAFNLVSSQAQDVIQKRVSTFDSLVIHQHRDELGEGIKQQLQELMNASDPNTFKITRVVVKNVLTDGGIEESIRKNVTAQKELEAMKYRLETADKQAQLNAKLNQTYTKEYLQHEYNEALKACASNQHCTMIVGTDSATPLVNLK